jgi:hypothetical protein
MTLTIRQLLAFAIIASGTLASQAAGPSLVLQSPAAGSQYSVGDTMVIRWTIDFSQISSGVMLQVSPDGRYWLTLDGLEQGTIKQTDPRYAGNEGTFRWVVKDSLLNAMGTRKINLVSDSCKVKIYAPYDRDSLGAWPMAVSQGIFSIHARGNMGIESRRRIPAEHSVIPSSTLIIGMDAWPGSPARTTIAAFAIDGSVMGPAPRRAVSAHGALLAHPYVLRVR